MDRRAAAGIIVALAGVLGACGDADDGASELTTAGSGLVDTSPASTASSAATTSVASGTAAFSISSMLDLLPAEVEPDGAPIVIVAGDLDLASDAAGVERPVAVDDVDALFDWASAIAGGGNPPSSVASQLPVAVRFDSLRHNPDIAAEFGWSILDVRAFIEVQNPPATFSVLRTDLTDDDLERGEAERTGDIWRLGGEDGEQNLRESTPGRRLGESLRFGLRGDGFLGISTITPPVEAFLATGADTFADDPALVAVADALDAAGVYSAMIVAGEGIVTAADDGSAPSLETFDVLGIGLSAQGGEATATFVYHHATPEDAQANIAAAERLFAEGVSVVDGRPLDAMLQIQDVRADGSVSIVTAGFADLAPRSIWNMVYNRDVPTLSG